MNLEKLIKSDAIRWDGHKRECIAFDRELYENLSDEKREAIVNQLMELGHEKFIKIKYGV